MSGTWHTILTGMTARGALTTTALDGALARGAITPDEYADLTTRFTPPE